MATTRKALCNQIWCESASDLPAAGQFTGQVAIIDDDPVLFKLWNGSAWVTTRTLFSNASNISLTRFGKTTITATTTPTSIASFTIPAGTMGTDSAIVTWLWGSYFNDSGANRGVRVVLDLGGTTRIDASSVNTYLAVSATIRRAWWMQVCFKNVAATNVNWCHINMAQSAITPGAMAGAPATGTGGWELGFAGVGGQFSCAGEMAIDTTASVAFDVKLSMSAATATQEWVCEGGVMLLE